MPDTDLAAENAALKAKLGEARVAIADFLENRSSWFNGPTGYDRLRSTLAKIAEAGT